MDRADKSYVIMLQDFDYDSHYCEVVASGTNKLAVEAHAEKIKTILAELRELQDLFNEILQNNPYPRCNKPARPIFNDSSKEGQKLHMRNVEEWKRMCYELEQAHAKVVREHSSMLNNVFQYAVEQRGKQHLLNYVYAWNGAGLWYALQFKWKISANVEVFECATVYSIY